MEERPNKNNITNKTLLFVIKSKYGALERLRKHSQKKQPLLPTAQLDITSNVIK